MLKRVFRTVGKIHLNKAEYQDIASDPAGGAVGALARTGFKILGTLSQSPSPSSPSSLSFLMVQ